MAPRPRKSSACVTLVLIGAAAVSGCSDAPDQVAARAKQYPTKEACVADWGNPDDCEQQVAQERDGTRRPYYAYSGAHSGSGWWWGSGRGSGGSNAGRNVSRGGFGVSGQSHASAS
jgi:hypothetical protein